MTSQKGLHLFNCKRWAPYFEDKHPWATF